MLAHPIPVPWAIESGSSGRCDAGPVGAEVVICARAGAGAVPLVVRGLPRRRVAPYDAAVTLYEVLGVAPDASAAEVRRAYVDQARRHHPDFHTTDDVAVRRAAEREMQRINDAWTVLGDPRRRRAYDDELRGPASDRGFVAAPDDGWDPRSGAAHPDFVPVDGDDDPDYNALLDEVDDRPYRGARTVPRWQQILPVALFLGALGCLSVGLVVSLTALLGAAIVLFLASAASFVLTPMLAVLRGFDRDPER